MSDRGVSVIMAAYNGEAFITQALGSLTDQGHEDLEILVVVDSRSADDTRGIVSKLADADSRIRLIDLTERHGLFHALNVGLTEAAKLFVTFLDCDDICPPGRIARQVQALHDNAEAGAVFGEVLLFEKLDENLQPLPGTRWARVLSPSLSAGTFRREAIDNVGTFDETFSHSADIDYLLRLHDSRWPIRIEAELGLLARKHADNMSADAADVQRFLLRALHKSIQRRRARGQPHAAFPFALMKPVDQVEGSETGFAGHRTVDLFRSEDV